MKIKNFQILPAVLLIFIILSQFMFSCQILSPEESGDIRIIITHPEKEALGKTGRIHLKNLHCILERSGILVGETIVGDQDGFFYLSFKDLIPDTTYHLSLYAGATDQTVDAIGEKGNISIIPNKVTTVEIVIYPMVPDLNLPANREICNGPDVSLSWIPCKYAHEYMLMISTDPLFTQQNNVIMNITETKYLLSGITEPVSLYWKVASMHESRGSSQWSEVRNVQVN